MDINIIKGKLNENNCYVLLKGVAYKHVDENNISMRVYILEVKQN